MNRSLTNWKEARRLQAWHLKPQGWPQRRIAKAFGVSEGAVSQWVTRARAGGPESLRHSTPLDGGATRSRTPPPPTWSCHLWGSGQRVDPQADRRGHSAASWG